MPPEHIPRHRRPPWWPENEPWPPNGAPHWRNRRGRFFWRMGCLLALILALAYGGCAVFVALVVSLSGTINSPQNSAGFVGPAAIVVLLLSLAGIFWIGRSFRRAAQPIGDVMEVAGRVAAGDYSARVRERGPREVRALAHEFNIMAERLQSNDDQRRRLLADVTHELRTPLTVIQGNLEGMLDGIYQPDQTHLEWTLEETRVMSRLIDDLRTLALTESGALKLQLEPTDPGVLLNEVAASFQAQAKAAGVQLSADSTTDLPLIEMDPARIRQVLTNLIANALRYTSSGGAIHVQGNLTDAAIEITVRDTGRGIAPQDLPHIFDRYYKSSDSRGTGLGLAIAKSLVTAHSGEMTAQSEVGKGTTIAFRLPIMNPPQV